MVAFTDREGTADDPLVAKSYIDEGVPLQIMQIVDEAVAEIENVSRRDPNRLTLIPRKSTRRSTR